MARRYVALGVAVLVLALGGAATPTRYPVSRVRPILVAVQDPRPAGKTAKPHGVGRAPKAAALVPRGTGPAGSLRTTGTPSVALTFDDGPFPYTPQVLDLLAQYHVKATFCVIGRQVAEFAEYVKRIVAEGHTLCDHTFNHDLSLGTRPPDRMRAEMQRTLDAIHAVVPGVPVRYFRCPGGLYTPQIVDLAASMGMTSLDWNVDPQDWRRPGVGPIIGNVLGHAGPGAIILMHDGGGDRSQTVAALRTILPELVRRYQLVALPT